MTDPPQYITPRVGPRTGGAALAVSLAVGWLAASPAGTNRMLAVGAIYALASVGWAMTSAFGHALVRSAVRIGVALAAVYTLHQSGDGGWQRYLLHVGGMMVGQNATLSLLRLPNWQPGSPSESDEQVEQDDRTAPNNRGGEPGAAPQHSRDQPGPRLGDAANSPQFAIADVIQSTAVLAVLFAVGRQWATPVAEPYYWVVLLALWLLVPALTGCALSAVLTRRAGRRWGFGFGMLTLAAATSVMLALAEAWAATIDRDPSASNAFEPLTEQYSAILLAFTTVVTLVAIAARGDAPKNEREE